MPAHSSYGQRDSQPLAEVHAQWNGGVNQAVLQELSSIRTELKYLNRSSDELKAQVSAITSPLKRPSASGD